jgi:site-specific DNA recombinase
MTKLQVRCAIYTRKSSEEGLEQSFNSLEAQQEACRAYILSQKHEGWSEIKKHYDDGGFSGGTMERPALKRLLSDIQEGQIDNVVVYKVDRLTRSLADFAKIIEILDTGKVSFVSVTQPFNTTTSMGRLTLNVLLSFAQFEREITGERIRDKVAASKKKGLWMGGVVPLGYDCVEHQLIINQAEAQTVRSIFRQYLSLGCVKKLKHFLDQNNVISKHRKRSSGRMAGGTRFSRGALYHLLNNRIYQGEIVHQNQFYPGQHGPIIRRELWDAVAALLRKNNRARRTGKSHSTPSLLAGKLFDANGTRFTPTHAVKKSRPYRYYTSQAAIRDAADGPAVARFHARDIEELVESQLCLLLRSPEKCLVEVGDKACHEGAIDRARGVARGWPKLSPSKRHEIFGNVVKRVVLARKTAQIEIDKIKLSTILMADSPDALKHLSSCRPDTLKLNTNFDVLRRGGQLCVTRSFHPSNLGQTPVASLLKAVVRARDWYERIVKGAVGTIEQLADEAGVTRSYVRRILQCASLSPQLVDALLTGTHAPDLTLKEILHCLPLDWRAQEGRVLRSH